MQGTMNSLTWAAKDEPEQVFMLVNNYQISPVNKMANCNMITRLAKEADLPAVLEMSEGVYGGHDYFLVEFLNFVKDPSRRILIAEMDGKAVGLQAIHIVDEGETAIAHSLRVHYKYQCRGIGKRLIQECRNYVRANFPQVKFERYVTRSDARLAIQKKSDDLQFHQAATFRGIVNANSSGLNSRIANSLIEQSVNLKQLNKTGLEVILNEQKLRNILFQDKYLVLSQPFKPLASNIANGLFKDGDTIFASYSSESVEALSHSRWSSTPKCYQLRTVCYTQNKELLKIHLVKQLKRAIVQRPGEMFIFMPIIDTSLVDTTKHILFKNLLLKNLWDGMREYSILYYFEKSLV
ncbi:histidine N-acetyltransferase-like [Dendronephthya gigantea]|uniref:histidine N-acetyltransferase-like n=1 Tax=Dendronephthya gigantea TaxID=151771 RepID=UPI00106AB76E|nr:histidine N-acetyltransferase-like [Dendronephthya gigantea]